MNIKEVTVVHRHRPQSSVLVMRLLSASTFSRSLPLGVVGLLLLIVSALPLSVFAQNTVTLPVEVYPADGRSSTVDSVTINASNGAEADRLYFQMHQPFYHVGGWDVGQSEGFDPATMVDIRLNGGSWHPLNNSNVTCASPDKEFGCVGVVYNTIRFSFPTSTLGATVDGENTVEFRFNGTEGIRSGFRVLAIGFMRPSDNVDDFIPLPKADATDDLIDGTTFEYWNPDSWTPPAGHDNAQSIADGEALWTAENAIIDLDGTEIVAGCASCHANDGRDLQYFSFSNKTIIGRSRAHGLTQTEGEKIAAYIRSLSFTLSDGSTPAETNSPGTPWDPPYQPGPTGFGPDGTKGPDEADPYYWAAGAGLEWALDTDEETLPYTFPASGNPKNPQGIARTANGDLPWSRYKVVDESEWGGNGGTDRGTAVNMREIPVSMQFPDWNNWLPDIHPHDGLDGVFDGSELEATVDNGHSVFSSGDLSSIRYWIDDLNGEYQSGIIEPLESGASQTSNSLSSIQIMHARTSGRQWRLVKAWYFMHEYGMEDDADDFYCDGSEDEWCEPLGWLGDARLPFDIAPHVSGTTLDNAPYTYGTQAGNYFYSHAWYQLQMVINPGTPGMGGTTPIDEGYQETFLKDVPRFYSHSNGYRQIMSEWKLLQIQSNDLNFWRGPLQGNVGPDRLLMAACCGATSTTIRNGVYSQLDKNNLGLMLEAFFRAMNTYMVGEDGNEGRIATLPRTSDVGSPGDGTDYPHVDYNPTPGDFIQDFMYVEPIYEAFAGNLYKQTTPFDEVFPNISRGALDSLLAQGDLLAPDDRDDGYAGEVTNDWPTDQPRWHDFVEYEAAGKNSPTVVLTTPSDGASFTAPADIALSADASDADGSITKVTFYAGSTQIAEVASAPYEATWSSVPTGNYTLTAEATDDSSAITTSSAVNVTVIDSLTAQNGTNYTYYEGDWSQLPDFGSLSAITTGTTANFDLSVRERDEQFGLRFVSYVEISSDATGTYTFYTASDDGSRLLVDGQTVVDNDGTHAPQEESGTVSLSNGWHEIVVEYFEQSGGEALTVSWSGPNFSQTEFAPGRLFLSPSQADSQRIDLSAGWNLISSRLAPSDSAMTAIFESVATDLAVVQNQKGDTYDPAVSSNSLTTWDDRQGYRVYMNAADTLAIDGAELESQTLQLNQGWNLIPFYPASEMPVADAFDSISDKVEIVKDEAGNSYVPSLGVDEIGSLQPGRAYKVFVTSATSFSYP